MDNVHVSIFFPEPNLASCILKFALGKFMYFYMKNNDFFQEEIIQLNNENKMKKKVFSCTLYFSLKTLKYYDKSISKPKRDFDVCC